MVSLSFGAELVNQSSITEVLTDVNRTNYLTLEVQVDESYQSGQVVTLSIQNKTLYNDRGSILSFYLTTTYKSPSLPKVPYNFLEDLIKFLKGSSSATNNVLKGWSVIGANCVISNLVSFFHLTIFYVLIPLPTLQPIFRDALSSIFVMMRGETLISSFIRKGLRLYKNYDFLSFIPE